MSRNPSHGLTCLAIGAWLNLCAAAPGHAEEINTRFRGLTLSGDLVLSDGRGLEDGVALIVHDTLADRRAETVVALQKNLATRGIATLAITLSLGVDRRAGPPACESAQSHLPFDALDEIDAWVGWLKNHGAADIALIGHGEGGNQVAVYAAERDDPSIGGLVLLAPATFDFTRAADSYRTRYDSDLPALLARAQNLVQSGQAVARLTHIGFLSCPDATVSAAGFAAWYAPSPLRDTPSVLRREKIRTLIIAAGGDESFSDLGPALEKLERSGAPGRGEIQVKTIEGADHSFSDAANDGAADLIAEWLKG